MPRLKQSSRADVLEVASRVFTEHGFGETSLRQLIAETGMSPTAFYARYPSKQAVLEALVQDTLSRVFLAISAVFVNAKGVEAAFEGVPRVLVEELVPRKAVVRLVLTEAAVLPSLRHSLHGAYSGLVQLAGGYLAKVGVEDAEAIGWSMLGAIYIHLMRWSVFEQIDDAKLVRELETMSRLSSRTARQPDR
jgi:AcrR family transcriptional regulator